MNYENYDTLVATLQEQERNKRFTWRMWVANSSCGTVACVAGWAAVLQYNTHDIGRLIHFVSDDGLLWNDVLMNYLGIDCFEAKWISIPEAHRMNDIVEGMINRGYSSDCLNQTKGRDWETAMHRLRVVHAHHKRNGISVNE